MLSVGDGIIVSVTVLVRVLEVFIVLVDAIATVLLDDIVTSGATLKHCASALKAAGASRVSALVLSYA